MTFIQMVVFAGVLMLITALNLKLAIWYIERKKAKCALVSYTNSQQSEVSIQPSVPFTLSNIKCVDSIAKNIDTYLDTLTSNEIDKIGIIKENKLVAVLVSIQRYENMIARPEERNFSVDEKKQ
ncbi:MAG: hypothetical protein ACMV1K_07285 [Sulfurospirillum sp.]|jgi:hypothetical protein